MAYMKIIESTSTWTCPKTADYKIICVAGGQSGASTSVAAVSGGATSFGSHLTASGAWSPGGAYRSNGGTGGYTLITYGGVGSTSHASNYLPPINNGGGFNQDGLGYGAGGKAGTDSSAGGCGKLMMIIVTITSGTNITLHRW